MSHIVVRIHSADQPDVRALIYAKRDDDNVGQYPKLAEIQAALGDLIDIQSPQ